MCFENNCIIFVGKHLKRHLKLSTSKNLHHHISGSAGFAANAEGYKYIYEAAREQEACLNMMDKLGKLMTKKKNP